MALRVLLADESPTIKKVFKLSLQDYGAEIRTITSGPDVPMAINDFNPDIIFSDVLLPKKNGYDVCAEVKENPATQTIPYILMWSSFMDIDQEKYTSSGADDKLEKPFEAKNLRDLIKKYVPKTETQNLSDYLDLPELPDMEKEIKSAVARSEAQALGQKEITPLTAQNSSELQLENDDPLATDEFTELSLPLSKPEITKIDDSELINDDESLKSDWSQEGLTHIQLSADPDEDEELSLEELISPKVAQQDISPSKEPATNTASSAQLPQEAHEIDIHNFLSKEEIENIIREQAQKVIENIAWKIMPDLATQIIERELTRLLEEKGSKEI